MQSAIFQNVMRKRSGAGTGLVRTSVFRVISLVVTGVFAVAGPREAVSAGMSSRPEHPVGPLNFVQFDDCAARFADALRRWPVVDRTESPVLLASPRWTNETSVVVKDGPAFAVRLGEAITMRSGSKVQIASPGAAGCQYATELALVSASDSRDQPILVLRFSVTRAGLGSPVLEEVYTVRTLPSTRPVFSFFGPPASRPSERLRAAQTRPTSRPRGITRAPGTAPSTRPAFSLFGRPAERLRTAQSAPASRPAPSLFGSPARRPSGGLRAAQTAPSDRIIAFQHGKVLLKAGGVQQRVTVLGERTWRDGSGRLCVELKLESRPTDTTIDVAGRYTSARDNRPMRLPQAIRVKVPATNPTTCTIPFPKTATKYELTITAP